LDFLTELDDLSRLIRERVTHVAARSGEGLPSRNIDYRPLLLGIVEALTLNTIVQLKGIKQMANDFTGLSAALDAVVAGIQEVAAAIANPAVDNNDQAVIDGFTAKLTAAADALKAATAAENAEDGTTTTAPADGSGSTDVTP
jgi:hypothetical protein